MSKNTITRAQAIAFAYDVILGITTGDGFALEEDNAKAAEVLPVLLNMHEQLVKPRAKAVSKARKMNENLAERICECFPIDGSTVTTKDVVNMGFPEITTTQKAAAVLRVACEMGLAEKVVDKKNITYKSIAKAE